MSSKAIADRKEACGYTPATLRTDNCGGCKHAEMQLRDPDTRYERRVLFCTPHQIPVTVGSKCVDWSAK